MDFANKLFDFRVRHGLSQRATAEILGTERTSIVHYENGKTVPTRLRQAIMEKKMDEYERGKKNV